MRFVIFVNGLALLFAAGLMWLDAVLFADTRAVFMEAAILAGFLGGALALVSYGGDAGLRRSHTFLLTGSIWLTASLAGATPLLLWGLTPVDALFESVSGITTTGSTVMVGLDATAPGVLLWRAMLQAVGGVGFIVTGIALLPILKVGGMQLFRTESSDKSEKELVSAAAFAAATLRIYIALMALCTLVYLIGGMSLFDAATHAMTTVSTGGYSTYDASFGHFESGFLQWSAVVFMLAGALPFAWYVRGLARGRWRSEQVSAMLLGLGGAILVLSFWVALTTGTPPLTALRLVAFNVVSVVTTTGYATTDYTLWGPFAVAAFFTLTAIGGCTGSTAGGAKAMRWIVFARSTMRQFRLVHHPHGVFRARYEGKPVEDDVVAGVMTFFVFYFATVVLLALGLAFTGLDVSTAASGALTAVANVGPGIGDIIGPAGNFAPLNDTAKLLLSAGMFLGRLEMLTIYVLLTATFWRHY